MRFVFALATALLLVSAPSLACPASEKEGMSASSDAVLQSVEVAEQPKAARPAEPTPDRSKGATQPKQPGPGRSDG